MPRILILAIFLAVSVAARADHVDQTPLPPLDAILKRAAENAKREPENDRLFNQRYEFTRTKVTEFRNADGELTKREQKTSVNHVRPKSATVISKPQPASVARAPKLQTQTTSAGKTSNRVDKNDLLLNQDLISRFQFNLIGREQIAGRPVLVLDFKPANKKLPNNDFKDRFINIAAGRIWMDEEDCALVKADLHLTQKVNVIGGLVGAVGKFNCTLARERTTDGLWFTRAMNWHLEGRAVLARRTIDYHEEKTGVLNKATP